MSDALGFAITPSPPVVEPTERWRLTLLDAAREIERRGWCRGAKGYGFGKTTTGPLCIVGAIYRVGGDMVGALDAINSWCPPGASSWNDSTAKDVADVLSALRHCAHAPARGRGVNGRGAEK